jgi:hypothetical protein
MAKMQSTLVIERPIRCGVPFLHGPRPERTEDRPGVGSVTKTPDGRVGPGTARFRQENLGKGRETATRFTSIEPNRKIEFEAEIGPMRPKCDLTFQPTEAGTRVIFTGDSNPVGLLKLLSPMFNRKGQHVWTERLARIKTALESSTS